MKKEALENDLKETTLKLLEIARKSCWNKISNNCTYILSEIEMDDKLNFFKQRIKRKKINNKKTPQSLKQVTTQLKRVYSNLYNLDLYVYHAREKSTIIEIQICQKSLLEKEYLEKIKEQDPTLHCKISIPPYQKNISDKYDVNWELGGLRHNLKMFWFRRIARRKLSQIVDIS